MWHRVTRRDESGEFLQKDYKRKSDAVKQVTKWASETLSMAEGNRVTLTIELVP